MRNGEERKMRVGRGSTSGTAIGWQDKRAERTTGTGTNAGPQCGAVNRGEKADAPTVLWCNIRAHAGGMLAWEECGEGRQLMAGCAALGASDLGVWGFVYCAGHGLQILGDLAYLDSSLQQPVMYRRSAEIYRSAL